MMMKNDGAKCHANDFRMMHIIYMRMDIMKKEMKKMPMKIVMVTMKMKKNMNVLIKMIIRCDRCVNRQ